MLWLLLISLVCEHVLVARAAKSGDKEGKTKLSLMEVLYLLENKILIV